MAKLLMRKDGKFLEAIVNEQGDLTPSKEINPRELSHFGTDRYLKISLDEDIINYASKLKKEYYNQALAQAITLGADYAYIDSPSPEQKGLTSEVRVIVFNSVLTLYIINKKQFNSF